MKGTTIIKMIWNAVFQSYEHCSSEEHRSLVWTY